MDLDPDVVSSLVVAYQPTAYLRVTPVERREFNYSALEEAMAHLDAVVRQSRHNLGALLRARGG